MSVKQNRPTIYDVARLAGVSTATVSRALNDTGQIAPATRGSIKAAVAQLGYRPNRIARSLATRSTQTIALLLPDITNPLYGELVRGVQELALEHEYTTLLCTTDGDPEREERYLDLLRAKQVDGALVDGLVTTADRIGRFVRDGFPIVCLDRDVTSGEVPVVQVDNRRGAFLATEHLLGLGHRRIAHVRGPAAGIADERLGGYREAHAAAGVAVAPELVADGGWTSDDGFGAVRRLLDARSGFTAVFAANDLAALGVLAALAQAGLRVPDDVSVVGFDDLRLVEYACPPLTTVRQPADEIARRATEILLQAVRGGEHGGGRHLFEPRLVVRASAAPPPAV